MTAIQSKPKQLSQILQLTNQGLQRRNLATGEKRGKRWQPKEPSLRFILINHLIGWESDPFFLLISQAMLHERLEPLTELSKKSITKQRTKAESFSKILVYWRITPGWTKRFFCWQASEQKFTITTEMPSTEGRNIISWFVLQKMHLKR